jgi:lipoate-protein ligase A
MERASQLGSVTGANDWIMERNRAALENALDAPVARQGHTDLTLRGRKFSGNAQRRKQKYLLFHGTLLLDFDLSLIESVLQLPRVRPDYRDNRPHQLFLLNLHLTRQTIKATLCQAWQASTLLDEMPHLRIEELVAQKYTSLEWNRKF